MIQPSDLYQPVDSMAESLSDVARNIKAIESYAKTRKYKVYWRGQARHEWGLVSSLVRRLASSGPVNDTTLNKVEDKLLQEASAWIQDLGEPTYEQPLARLAYLQHHQVPTRLLDFTSSPWMALFFAAESHDEVDGRIFALLVEDTSVLISTSAGTPWRTYKTNEVRVYDAVRAGVAFPRLAAQKGVLALGRLPSTRPYRRAYDETLGAQRSLLAEEVRRVLSIPFKLCPFDPTQGNGCLPNGAKAPIGLTFRVHVDKESVRRDLAGAGSGRKISPSGQKITHESLYPDVGGMVEHSKTLRGLDRGVLLI